MGIDKITIILILFVIIMFSRDEYLRRKYKLVSKAIKRVYFQTYISLVWFFVAFLYFSFDGLNKYFISYFLIAIANFILGLRRDIINDYGIITRRGKYKLKRIFKYECNDEIKTRRNKKYYIFKFFIKTYKIDEAIFGSDETIVKLEVPEKNKIKVEDFLKQKIN